jgi:hypothetical protein
MEVTTLMSRESQANTHSAITPRKSPKLIAGLVSWTVPQRSLFQWIPTYPIPGSLARRDVHNARGARYLMITERCNVALDWALSDKVQVWLLSFGRVCARNSSSDVYGRHIRRDLTGGKASFAVPRPPLILISQWQWSF